MDTLVFKVVASPLLIQAASLAGRRWGPAVGGWFVGLPLTSGPVAFFLAVDQGRALLQPRPPGRSSAPPHKRVSASPWLRRPAAFLASRLLGRYRSVRCRRRHPRSLRPPLWALLLVVESSLAAALLLVPHRSAADEIVPAAPRWDIPARMAVATLLVLVLTSAAPFLGARLAGLLATFPVFAAVLAVFAHRVQGYTAAQHVVRGLLLGLFAFSGFFVVVALTSLAAGAVQASTLRILSGSRSTGRRQIGCG